MLDLEGIIRRAVRETAAGAVAVAAPFDVPEQILRDLVSRGVIQGYVADRGSEGAPLDPQIAGWWLDRRQAIWCLKRRGPPTIIVLAADANHSVSGRMLLEARLNGVRRIVLAGYFGNVLRVLDTEAELLKALDRSRSGPQLGETDYEDMFHDIQALVGDWLRLPRESFVQDRALLVVGSLGPGGAERQVAYTAMGLKRSSAFEVHIACDHLAPPDDFFRPMLETSGAYVFEVSRTAPDYDTPKILDIRDRLSRYKVFGIEHIFHAIFHYALVLRSTRPRVMHTWMDHCSTLAGVAATLVGVPRIILGGRSASPESFRFFQPYMRPAYKALLRRRPDALLLNNSRAGAIDYARWLDLPADSIRVIHNGFEFPAEIPAADGIAVRRQHGLVEADTVIGSILRFSDEKRPRLLIDMARTLLVRAPSAKFLFFGHGVLLDDMRAEVAGAGLSDSILLPGLTRDVWGSLAAMDVFVLTSRIEGLPNVLVEAQASGLPIVCTGVGGMAETFIEGETGFSVEATSAALAEAVERIVMDTAARRHIRKRAFDHARHGFGIEAMVRSTLEAYTGPDRT